MKEKELMEVVHHKNDLIVKQTRKISQLEEKFSDLRSKYMRLKYDLEKVSLRHPEWLINELLNE
jgi:hypothetical protein